MGFWDKGIGILKDKTNELNDVNQYQRALLKTFSFTSIGGGSGSSTLINYIAHYLAVEKKKQVVVVDLAFLQPDLLYGMSVDVTSENSILKYLKGEKKLSDCYIQDDKIKNLHLITASPKDNIILLSNLRTDKNIIGEMLKELDDFDYILLNLPYVQNAITFIEPLSIVDKGYIVIDERLSAINKVKNFLDFIHKFQGNSNLFSNVVVNKRSNYEYPLDKIIEVGCNVITELPYCDEITNISNEKKSVFKEVTNKDYQLGMNELLDSMMH